MSRSGNGWPLSLLTLYWCSNPETTATLSRSKLEEELKFCNKEYFHCSTSVLDVLCMHVVTLQILTSVEKVLTTALLSKSVGIKMVDSIV